jgi:adenylate cyclase
MVMGNGERAISALEKAIDLNPCFANAYNWLGCALLWFGRAEEAFAPLNRAIRLSPHDPLLWNSYYFRSWANGVLENFDAAITDAKAAIQAKSDEFWPYVSLAWVSHDAGRIDEARAAYDRACALRPGLSEAFFQSALSTAHPPYREKFLEILRKLGLPEK